MGMGRLPGEGDDAEGDGVFADINITPLTDIFLVLLIIFMVTSTVIVQQTSPGAGGAQSGLKVDLPQGSAADVKSTAEDLAVAILADGRLVIGGEVVSASELALRLAAAREKSAGTLVIVQADEGVPHGKVVEVMEAAKSAGLGQLAIGVRQP